MIAIIFFFLILLILAELYCLVSLSEIIGFWESVAIILSTGIIGAVIARKNAKIALTNLLKGRFSSTPEKQIFDAISLFTAAALLLIPGLITDIAGLFLLLPWTRNRLFNKLKINKLGQRQGQNQPSSSTCRQHNSSGKRPAANSVIDIDAEEVE